MMQQWETSEAAELVIGAFIAALSEVEDVEANREANTGTYSYSYANLADVNRSIKAACQAHGLMVSQVATSDGPRVSVGTTILHTSSQWMAFAPLSMPTGNSPQATGSAITYARRYALVTIFGVSTEDDDGARAEQATRTPQTPVRAQQRPQGGAGGGSGSNRSSQGRPAPAPNRNRSEWEPQVHQTLASLSGEDAKLVRASFLNEFGTNMSNLAPDRHQEALTFVNEEIARLREPQPLYSEEEPF